jgi:hypothetical protein
VKALVNFSVIRSPVRMAFAYREPWVAVNAEANEKKCAAEHA